MPKPFNFKLKRKTARPKKTLGFDGSDEDEHPSSTLEQHTMDLAGSISAANPSADVSSQRLLTKLGPPEEFFASQEDTFVPARYDADEDTTKIAFATRHGMTMSHSRLVCF